MDEQHYPERHEVDAEPFRDYEAEIAQRAHELWIERGCRQGSHQQDWLDAEREIRAKRMSATTRQPEDSGTVQHELPGTIRR